MGPVMSPIARRQDSLLVVIDVQERLFAAMNADGRDQVARNVPILVRAARQLEVPIVVTQQYPRGLGPTVPPVREALEGLDAPLDKLVFSVWRDEAIRDAIARTKRRSVVLCGIEAHVCVLQSAVDLCEAGYTVHVCADAVTSRHPANHATALDAMRQRGVWVVSTEIVVFGWLERAGTDAFRAVSRLVR